MQVIQKQLLAEKSLNFEKALKIALAVEAAENDVKQLQKSTGTVMYQAQARNQQPPNKQSTNQRSPACYGCLGKYLPQSCHFKKA